VGEYIPTSDDGIWYIPDDSDEPIVEQDWSGWTDVGYIEEDGLSFAPQAAEQMIALQRRVNETVVRDYYAKYGSWGQTFNAGLPIDGNEILRREHPALFPAEAAEIRRKLDEQDFAAFRPRYVTSATFQTGDLTFSLPEEWLHRITSGETRSLWEGRFDR
jgi:hypothetical protein